MKKILLIICLSGLLLADNVDLNITDVNLSSNDTPTQVLDVNLSKINTSIPVSDINLYEVNVSIPVSDIKKIVIHEQDHTAPSKILPGCKV